jgi:hypothetical protein
MKSADYVQHSERCVMKPSEQARTASLLALIATLLALVPAGALGQVRTHLQPGEVDTADRPGGVGQAGGQRFGNRATEATLRCNANEAIVGVRIQRGHVLDYLQIACGATTCDANGCRWTSMRWGPASGDTNGGDPHPPTICGNDEMVSGIRARVRLFVAFDYASDVAIECSRMTMRTAQGFFRVTTDAPAWHHAEGGFARTTRPADAPAGVITPVISCRPNGGATAIATAAADWPFRPGHRVAQALSLLCPATGADPRCPQQLVVAGLADQSRVVNAQWFARGGRTGGVAVSTMEARPATRNWSGARITETVQLTGNSCNLPGAANYCGVGGRPNFTVGVQGNAVDLPTIGIQVPWTVPAGAQARNSFPDTHGVFDAGAGGPPAGIDILGQRGLAGPCTIQCTQTYTCGAGGQQVQYPPFTVTYTLRHDTFQPQLGPIPIPTGQQQGVTRVDVTKR